jgi:hypothetical protein
MVAPEVAPSPDQLSDYQPQTHIQLLQVTQIPGTPLPGAAPQDLR